MIFGKASNYMLKYQKAKAKLVEYGTSKEDYPDFRLNSNDLSFPTTYVISRYAECMIENKSDELLELEQLLPIVAQYYDAAFNSKDRQVYDFDFLLTGASAYFLASNFGSAKVLTKKMIDESLMPEHGPQNLLLTIFAYLLLNRTMRYIKVTDSLSKINNEFLDCFEKGWSADGLINNLNDYRHEIYGEDNPDDVFYVDILIATIYKALENSSWKLLPEHSGENVVQWVSYLQKRFAIKMLWPAQRLIAETGILRGENAIVQLPTGVGKTKSIELIIRSAYIAERAKTVVIVAPLRALCNEITSDLSKAFRNEVTINQFSDVLQDDFLFDQEHQKEILICTPEKLSYVIHHQSDFINMIDLFILDEGHMFDDGSRGVTYELLVSQIKSDLSEQQQLVLLSAVLPNSDEIKDWLFSEYGVLAANPNITSTPKSIGFTSTNKDVFFYSDNAGEADFYVPRVVNIIQLNNLPRERAPRFFPKMNSSIDIAIYNALKLCNNGGVAIYIGRQQSMKTIFNRIIELHERKLNMQPFKANVNYDELVKLGNLIEEYYGKEHYYTKVCQLGILPHSSNVPNGVKLAVEHAIKKNHIFSVVCTSTLAQGVNIPIKNLLITSIRNGQKIIKTRNFQNLIGRTARSGIHTEGNVIITDSKIYDNKSDGQGYYLWQDCINLFDVKKSEDCSSSILMLVKNLCVDYDTKYSSEQIVKYILDNYDEADCFKTLAERINKAYLKRKPNKVQNNIFDEILFRQQILASIENHLCLSFSNSEEKDRIEITKRICQGTLAYFLATDDEKELLEQIFCKVEEKLREYSSEQLFNYAHAMSGIDLSAKIEQWIEESGITESFFSEEQMLEMIVDFFISLKNAENEDQIRIICQMWIDGKTSEEISKIIDIDTYKIDDICNKIISYDLNFFIGNICDLLIVDEENEESVNPTQILTRLQKKVKYGVPNDTAISICEKIFYDRILSILIADIINDTDISPDKIIHIVQLFQDEIFELLQDYPEYFSDRLKFLLS